MTDNDLTYFELIDSGDFIRIELITLNYPKAELDWDRNWIKAKVTLKAGAFSGQFDADLMTVDFEKFKNEMKQLYDKLDGMANFNTLEDYINIKINGDGLGHFIAKCTAMDTSSTGNKLDFEITFDQTILPDIVYQLDNITKKFPVTGELK